MCVTEKKRVYVVQEVLSDLVAVRRGCDAVFTATLGITDSASKREILGRVNTVLETVQGLGTARDQLRQFRYSSWNGVIVDLFLEHAPGLLHHTHTHAPVVYCLKLVLHPTSLYSPRYIHMTCRFSFHRIHTILVLTVCLPQSELDCT